jgi:hypothetical protein
MAAITKGSLDRINSSLAIGLEEAQRALRGECVFAVEQVQMLAAPIAEMESVMKRASVLRAEDPNLAPALDFYVSQLREFQRTLESLRIMLLMQRERLNAGRLQLSAARDWASAFQQTC